MQVDRRSSGQQLVFVLNTNSFGTNQWQVPDAIKRCHLPLVFKYPLITQIEAYDGVKELIFTYLGYRSLRIRKWNYWSATGLGMIHEVD